MHNQDPDQMIAEFCGGHWQFYPLVSFKSLPHRYRNDRGDSSNSGEETSAASLKEKATRDQQARPGSTGVGECCSTVRQRRRKR